MGSRLVDRTGEVHGRLTVLERAEDYVSPKGKRHVRWVCECECGNVVTVTANQLRDVQVRSCGCLRREVTSRRVLQDLTGQLFGDWVVLERAADNYVAPCGGTAVRWVVECICGTVGMVTSGNLRQRQTTSCGHPVLPGYYSVHFQLSEVCGSASEHQCADCGGPASDWSYNHAADVEISEWVRVRGKPALRRYSLDPDDYAPRCRSCHTRLDRAYASA